MTWTTEVPADFILAPDGSQIRPLQEVGGGGVSHCTLPPGGVSMAVRHRTIEEIWFVVGGRGQVWRKSDEAEECVDVAPGTCLSIPTGTHFQFRALGEAALEIVIATMPPWPGMDEAVRVDDFWPVA